MVFFARKSGNPPRGLSINLSNPNPITLAPTLTPTLTIKITLTLVLTLTVTLMLIVTITLTLTLNLGQTLTKIHLPPFAEEGTNFRTFRIKGCVANILGLRRSNVRMSY